LLATVCAKNETRVILNIVYSTAEVTVSQSVFRSTHYRCIC